MEIGVGKKAGIKPGASRSRKLLIAGDIGLGLVSWLFALYCSLNFNFGYVDSMYILRFPVFILVYLVSCIIINSQFHLYRTVWKFASYKELENIALASIISLFFAILLANLFLGSLPVSFYVMGFGLQVLFSCTERFGYRFAHLIREDHSHAAGKNKNQTRTNAMIIGAGQAGQMLLRDANNSDSDMNICCFIDDDPEKAGCYIDGIEVFGSRDHILEAVDVYNISRILFAAPSASAKQKKDILAICSETDCEIKVLPSLLDLASNKVSLSSLKNIEMTDLLGRDPIQVDTTSILNAIENKIILVTGGGGSIGSELCRQIAAHNPRQLIIFDIYENNAYEIQQELVHKYPDLNLKVLIGSVRDTERLEQAFETYHPQIVFHAAAHKHVPLMEVSPCEAIKNNTIGTYKTARCAALHGVERFVLISTDKAVNPTNIMGASKRLCEMIVQSMDFMVSQNLLGDLPQIGKADMKMDQDKPKTQFVMVRFGNVLGSNGSVIPLFKKQIESGGPVTVTDKEIVRYFMTIPEAVSLVLEASADARGGEIFVLDMGEPVKIDDLARNLIRQMGYIPDEDIEIQYTGLRPGEKLYEEKLLDDEILGKTENDLIYIGKPLNFDKQRFLMALPDLYNDAINNEEGKVIEDVENLVSTYHPDWVHFDQNGIHPTGVMH